MIQVEITEEMKKRAWAKSREMGVIKNSIMKGDGNIAGFIGEEVANVVIEGNISNTYDYDIVDKTTSSTMLKQKDAPQNQSHIMIAQLLILIQSSNVIDMFL